MRGIVCWGDQQQNVSFLPKLLCGEARGIGQRGGGPNKSPYHVQVIQQVIIDLKIRCRLCMI